MRSLMQRTRRPISVRDEAGVDAGHEPAWIRRKMPYLHVGSGDGFQAHQSRPEEISLP